MRPTRRHRRLWTWLAAGVLAGALAGCGGALETSSEDSRFTPVAEGDKPVQLHSEEAGQGEPILMLHGFGASAYTWRHIRRELARAHHVIAVDMKGFGRSDKPLDDTYSPIDQARLLADFVEQRGLKRLTIMGHSFGGAVALALALDLNQRKPGQLHRLVLLDSAAYPQGLPPALHVLRTPYLGPASAAIVPPEVQSAAALMLAYQDPFRITKEDIAAYARPMYDAGNRHALVRSAEKIFPEYINVLTHRYRTIEQPALLVWCRNDLIVPLAIGQRLAREMPNAHLKVIESCAHVPQEEAPEATLALVRPFLAR